MRIALVVLALAAGLHFAPAGRDGRTVEAHGPPQAGSAQDPSAEAERRRCGRWFRTTWP